MRMIKTSYCLNTGSLGKENKILDSKKEPPCCARAWLSPWARPSLVPGALSVICSQLFTGITRTNHIFQEGALSVRERGIAVCVRNPSTRRGDASILLGV